MAVADPADFERDQGISFKDKTLLQLAFVHRSFVNESGSDGATEDNERLEFLGDQVLGYVVSEELYRRYPQYQEGQLTSIRSALVRRETLARHAQTLGLGNYLLLGHGEEESGGRKRPAILCDAFEAFIGALYLDSGLDAARRFVCALIDPALQSILALDTDKDAKSRLQEVAQSHYQLTPTYRTVQEEGPDHAKEFTVEAVIGGQVYGQGKGFSKQNAAQAAAQEALRALELELFQSEMSNVEG